MHKREERAKRKIKNREKMTVIVGNLFSFRSSDFGTVNKRFIVSRKLA